MTSTHHNDDDLDSMDRAVADAQEILRRRVQEIESAKAEQPARLAAARADAEQAKLWASVEEPLHQQVTTIPSVDGASSMSLPNVTARELWGARLAFDLLDCERDDLDHTEAVINQLFSTVGGDTGVAMIIMSAALTTIASLVVPQLIDEIEYSGSNYDERVRLAEARAKAWNGRVAELRGPHDHVGDGEPGPDGVF